MRYDNNAVINNNYKSLQESILLFKIPMGTRKNIFVIYSQVLLAPSKRFARCALGAAAPWGKSTYPLRI